MKIITILSSHYPQSSIQTLLNHFEQSLADHDHQVQRMDLYQCAFDPTMKGDDFNQFRGGSLPQEILDFQTQLEDAELWCFFFPIWWCDVPAQIKGFLDRVLAKGFAYDFDESGARGLLRTRKVLMVSTLGNQRDDFQARWEDSFCDKYRHGVFGFCGIPEFEAHFLYNDGPDALDRHIVAMRGLAAKISEV